MRAESLQLGPEQQRAVHASVVQWLFAEAITNEAERRRFAIPQRDREHAHEALKTPHHAPTFDSREHDFRVRPTAKPYSRAFQLLPELEEVVNLAVEDDLI